MHALHEVSLAALQGQMVAVMGPSGSGKTTLLTIAGTLEDPTTGEVLIACEPVRNMSQAAKARLRRRTIGYVFQDFNLLPGLTAAENVSLPLELDGTPVRKAPLARGPRRPSTAWAWATGPATTPTSSPAASASGSRSPARWSASAASSWPTSRPARSTPSTARVSCGCCTAPARTAA